MRRIELSIRQLSSNLGPDERGALITDLLREFHRGCPLRCLRPLLLSDDNDVVTAGAFIAAELGAAAKPLLPDVVALLVHPAKWVRSDAIDVVLVCATGSDGSAIAAVLPLVEDTERGVRFKALAFLARASGDQLQAALGHLMAAEPASRHLVPLRWFTNLSPRDSAQVTNALDGSDALLRKYAGAAAVRISGYAIAPLLCAARNGDEDVSGFCTHELELIRAARDTPE